MCHHSFVRQVSYARLTHKALSMWDPQHAYSLLELQREVATLLKDEAELEHMDFDIEGRAGGGVASTGNLPAEVAGPAMSTSTTVV